MIEMRQSVTNLAKRMNVLYLTEKRGPMVDQQPYLIYNGYKTGKGLIQKVVETECFKY